MKLRNVACVAVFALLFAVGGCEKAAARAEPPPPRVSVAHPVVRELVDSDTYNGWLESPATVEVRARVRGHIEKVDFTDGQIVKQGDLLFELDPRPFQAEIDRAEEQVRVYQAQLVAAQREEARQKEMVSQGASSQRQVDKAEADAGALAAQVESSKHEVARRKLDLEYARITAPITGRIGRAMLTAGNLVNAGGSDPLLATIVVVDPMYVYFYVDERSLQRYQKMRLGEGATNLKAAKLPFNFGLETDSGFPYSGVLDFADNRVDPATGTIQVRGEASNQSGLLLPGSRVRIRVPLGKPRSAVLVPDTAVLSDQDKKYVLVIDGKNIVHRRDITPGRLLDDGMRVVLPLPDGGDALGADDWIIVQGLQSARVNYPVDPVKPTSPQATTQGS